MSTYDVSLQQAHRDVRQAMNLSDNERTRQYVNIVCQDTDLFLISHKVQSNIHDVCVCLGLEESKMDEIESQDTDQSTKIYCAFMAWSEKQERGTWRELAQCLSTLNDPELWKSVTEYLETTRPREGRDAQGQMNLLSLPMQESECGAAGPTSVALQPRIGENSQPNRIVKIALRELEERFNDLLVMAQTALESQHVPIGELHVRLSSFCVDIEDNIPFFDRHMLELVTKSRVSDIFSFMRRIKVWDPINYRVLTTLLRKCIPADHDSNIFDHFEQYSVQTERFKKETLLRDYTALKGRMHIFPHGCITVTVKFERKYNMYTLADLAEDEAFLAGEFLLHQMIFRFKESHYGCISVTWFMPACAVPLLEPPLGDKKREALEQRGVVELIVDEKYIYRFPSRPPRPLPLNSLRKDTPDYASMYDESIKNPDKFWETQAKLFLDWITPFKTVTECVKEKGTVKWFTGGQLNISTNCLDRHVKENPEKIALIWEKNRKEGEPHGTHEFISYGCLLEMTCRLANVLKTQCDVKKGDVVIVYMPTSPMAVAAMFACARIGAVHCVLYSVLAAKDLEIRITAARAKVVITATMAVIGDRVLMLKNNVDEALMKLDKNNESSVRHVLVAMGDNADDASADSEGDIHLERAMKEVPSHCEVVAMDSEDPLFIMYTSGTTGDPAGIIHSQAGYLLYAAMTHKHVFDYKDGEVFACMSVLGWITGHTYVVYGPLCNGATTVLFEGTATYPDAGRYWEMVERLKINHFYTSPSAIRKLMKEKDCCVDNHNLSSLKTIGSVGEPLPTAAWEWYFGVVGKEKCVLVDTYWQTELGGIVLSPQPGPVDGKLKPGACMRPFFGVEPVLTDQKGTILKGNGIQGLLCLKNPIPGMGRGIVKGKHFHERYFQCFPDNPGLYFTRDWAYRDIDGDYYVVGRQDDIIRIKGVWIQVPEIESSITKKSEKIENVSLVRLEEKVEEGKDSDTCVVVELKKTELVPENPRSLYQEIIDCVKGPIIQYAGTSALPKFVLLVTEQVKTWSEKICRNIWRYHIAHSYKPRLKALKVDQTNMITLLDLSHFRVPESADSSWLWLTKT